jgi:hypothetical protein
MLGKLARFYFGCGLLITPPACLVGANQACAAGYETHGLATYFILLEIATANPTGRLDEPSARRIASADWSLDLNRTTAAFGLTGRLGSCELIAAEEASSSQRAAGISAAVSYHAYVPPSYAYLPDAYQRDFVRGSLVGLASAVNTMLSDKATSADAKLLAVGQYLHFAQDMFFYQDPKTGKPFEAGIGALGQELGRAAAADRVIASVITDAALRALSFTYQVAKAFGQTGSLPPLPPLEKFDNVFYAPLAADERAQITKSLQDAGLSKYIDALVISYTRTNPAPQKNRPDVAANTDAEAARLKISLTGIWNAAHPNAPAIQPPQIDSRGGRDFVNYDGRPEWLVRKELRGAEMITRRPIDDLTLAQQASSQLRAKIEQFEMALKTDSSQQQRNSITIAVQALKKFSDDGGNALNQYAVAKDQTEKGRSIGTALSSFRQGLRYADQMVMAFAGTLQAQGSRQSGQTTSRTSCMEKQTAAIKAFEKQLNETVTSAVAVAFATAGAKLAPPDQQACLMVAFEDVRSLLKGAAPEVPKKCRAVANAGRAALVRYARAHLRTLNPDLEDLLSSLNARAPG